MGDDYAATSGAWATAFVPGAVAIQTRGRMSRIAPAAALVAALVSPAAAEQMLYATAAVANRVEGFCLGPNGGITTLRPVIQTDSIDNPRRLVIPDKPDGSPGNVLYVAGRRKVQSFLIKTNGGLESIGVTRELRNANPYDIAVDAARTHVYVPNRGAARVEAYPLNPETGGILGGDMTSCARIRSDVNLQDVEVGSVSGAEVLYVTGSTSRYSSGKRGRVDVFQLTDGELPDLWDETIDPEGAYRCGNPDATTTSTTTSTSSTSLTTLTTTVTTTTTSTTVDTRYTETLSTRKKMRGPGAFVLSDVDGDGVSDYLYVYDVLGRRIIEFALTNGLFTDDKQPRVTASNEVGRFLDLIGVGQTLLGAADNLGRVRALALKEDDEGLPTRVPKVSQRQTKKIVDSTPVRITAGTMDDASVVLYVPGGGANRVYGYRMVATSKGLFPEDKPFSATERRKATHPNDAAIAQIAGACP
jgi:hypothetical protein